MVLEDVFCSRLEHGRWGWVPCQSRSNRWQTQLFVGASMIHGCHRKHAWTNTEYCPVIPHTNGTSPVYRWFSNQNLYFFVKFPWPCLITQRKQVHHQKLRRNRGHDISNNKDRNQVMTNVKSWKHAIMYQSSIHIVSAHLPSTPHPNDIWLCTLPVLWFLVRSLKHISLPDLGCVFTWSRHDPKSYTEEQESPNMMFFPKNPPQGWHSPPVPWAKVGLSPLERLVNTPPISLWWFVILITFYSYKIHGD